VIIQNWILPAQIVLLNENYLMKIPGNEWPRHKPKDIESSCLWSDKSDKERGENNRLTLNHGQPFIFPWFS